MRSARWSFAVVCLSLLACRKAEDAPPPSPPTSASQPQSPNAAEKLAVARQLLAKGAFLVNLDPRRPGVVVPDRFRGDKRLVLQYGANLVPPIPDLELRDDGISATLSFSHQPFKTFVPWSAVFAIVDESSQGKVWNEDIPADLDLGTDGTK